MSRDDQEAAKVSARRSGATPAEEPAQPATFEEGLARLAELVGGLEGGRLGLAESIAAYEQGVSLVRRLHAELADVEQRVQTLTAAANAAAEDVGDDDAASGQRPAEGPQGGGATGPQKSAAKRTAVRTPRGGGGRPRRLPGMDDPIGEV